MEGDQEAMQKYRTSILKSAEAGIPLVGRFRHLMQDSLSMFYLALLIAFPWIMDKIITFTENVFINIPTYIR